MASKAQQLRVVWGERKSRCHHPRRGPSVLSRALKEQGIVLEDHRVLRVGGDGDLKAFLGPVIVLLLVQQKVT